MARLPLWLHEQLHDDLLTFPGGNGSHRLQGQTARLARDLGNHRGRRPLRLAVVGHGKGGADRHRHSGVARCQIDGAEVVHGTRPVCIQQLGELDGDLAASARLTRLDAHDKRHDAVYSSRSLLFLGSRRLLSCHLHRSRSGCLLLRSLGRCIGSLVELSTKGRRVLGLGLKSLAQKLVLPCLHRKALILLRCLGFQLVHHVLERLCLLLLRLQIITDLGQDRQGLHLLALAARRVVLRLHDLSNRQHQLLPDAVALPRLGVKGALSQGCARGISGGLLQLRHRSADLGGAPLQFLAQLLLGLARPRLLALRGGGQLEGALGLSLGHVHLEPEILELLLTNCLPLILGAELRLGLVHLLAQGDVRVLPRHLHVVLARRLAMQLQVRGGEGRGRWRGPRWGRGQQHLRQLHVLQQGWW
mmetsp:Transcript_24312/g.61648  ORF Transcript_24312/g.61648 Transcript_24312/m.61648 type:complete len:417 (+) Transcript_24312:196-1446(+)